MCYARAGPWRAGTEAGCTATSRRARSAGGGPCSARCPPLSSYAPDTLLRFRYPPTPPLFSYAPDIFLRPRYPPTPFISSFAPAILLRPAY
eukprot:402757-Rhodomonas_salina.1